MNENKWAFFVADVVMYMQYRINVKEGKKCLKYAHSELLHTCNEIAVTVCLFHYIFFLSSFGRSHCLHGVCVCACWRRKGGIKKIDVPQIEKSSAP